MLHNSAFFLKDARVFARQNLLRMARCLTWNGGVLLTVLVLLHLVGLAAQDPASALLGAYQRLFLLAGWTFTTLLYCGSLGQRLGDRVFKWEAKQGTLESLQLTPLEPWRLVTQKLLFPAAGLSIGWGCLLPFYLALSLCGIALPGVALRGWLLAGAAGVVGLAIGAMARSDSQYSRRRLAAGHGPLIGAHLWRNGLILVAALPALVVVLTASSDWMGVLSGWRSSIVRSSPFFTGYLRLDLYLVLALSSLLGSSLLSLLAVASPAAPIAPRLELAGRRIGAGATYGLALAYLWTALAPWLQLTAVLVPATCFLSLSWWGRLGRGRQPGARAVDRQRLALDAEGRLARWSNPLFLRDLRAATVRVPLWAQCWISTACTAAGILLLAALSLPPNIPGAFPYLFSSNPYWARFFWHSGELCAFLAPILWITALMPIGTSARRHWRREFLSGTLPQLLTTPIRTRDLLLGRFGASGLLALPGSLGLLAPMAVAVPAVRLFRPEWLVLYSTLVILLTGLGAHFVLLIGLTDRRGKTSLAIHDYALLTAGTWIAVWIGLVIENDAFQRSPALFLMLMGYALSLAHLFAAFLAFRRSIAEVEWLRLSDIPTG